MPRLAAEVGEAVWLLYPRHGRFDFCVLSVQGRLIDINNIDDWCTLDRGKSGMTYGIIRANF